MHDDLELRLRLASLARRAIPKLDADCISGAGFDALPPERLAGYVACCSSSSSICATAPWIPWRGWCGLAGLAPHLPIFVFARGGDERNAARTMKLGANDYWPVHSVKIGELGAVLQPLVEPASGTAEPSSGSATTVAAMVDPRRQPQIAGYRVVKTIAESATAAVYLARNDDWRSPWRSRCRRSRDAMR